MIIGITTHYAQPEISAASKRISSLQAFLEKNGHELQVFAPKKKGVSRIKGVTRFGNCLSLGRHLRRVDVVISTMPPGNISFKTAVACRILRKPFLLDVRDPWTEAQVILGTLKKGSVRYRIRRLMESFCFRNAKEIFFVSDYLKEMMKEEFGLEESKLHVAVNGYDPAVLKRKPDHNIRKKLGIGTNPAIIYVGIVGGKELDRFIVECEKTLKQRKVHVIFILTRDRDSEPLIADLRRMVEDKGLGKQFHFLSNLDDSELCGYLSSSDFGLNPLPANLNYCLPIKTFEYMACGIPTISKGPKTGPLVELHKKHDMGFYSTSWKEFDLKLDEAVGEMESYKRKGKAAMRASKGFTRERGNKIFLQVLEGLRR